MFEYPTLKETEFAVFCIEHTAEYLGISADKIVQELVKTNGIRDFLYKSYPTLHTQGKEYIVQEVLAYIRQTSPEFGVKQ